MTEFSVSDTYQATTDRFKAEGDSFFVQKQFKKAYSKYSEAIKLDGSNAILYANRAASALSMKEYVPVSTMYVHVL